MAVITISESEQKHLIKKAKCDFSPIFNSFCSGSPSLIRSFSLIEMAFEASNSQRELDLLKEKCDAEFESFSNANKEFDEHDN